MRVDHVDVGVAVVRESLSDVALKPLYRRRAPLGIQSSPALLWTEGEVFLGIHGREEGQLEGVVWHTTCKELSHSV